MRGCFICIVFTVHFVPKIQGCRIHPASIFVKKNNGFVWKSPRSSSETYLVSRIPARVIKFQIFPRFLSNHFTKKIPRYSRSMNQFYRSYHQMWRTYACLNSEIGKGSFLFFKRKRSREMCDIYFKQFYNIALSMKKNIVQHSITIVNINLKI